MSPTNFPTRQLGKNGPQAPAIGFGMMGLSIAYGKIDTDEERFKVLDYAYENGARFWDTANVYGDSEELIGKWFKRTGKRDEIFLASKFGCIVNRSEGTVKMSACGTPEYANSCFATSLARLGVDTIDLYYVHRIDSSTPIEHTMGVLVELVKAGKIKHIGLSECSASTLRRAYAVHPIACVQVEYSPFALEIEKPEIDLLAACRELGVSVVAYSPLGRGVLGGKIKSPDDFDQGDARRLYPRFTKENFSKNLDLVDKVTEVAKTKNATPGQVTLAWILAQGEDFIPLPGTKKIEYLKENIDAINVKLTPEEIAKIREFCEKCEVAGERANPALNNLCYGDSAPLGE